MVNYLVGFLIFVVLFVGIKLLYNINTYLKNNKSRFVYIEPDSLKNSNILVKDFYISFWWVFSKILLVFAILIYPLLCSDTNYMEVTKTIIEMYYFPKRQESSKIDIIEQLWR